MSFLFQMTTAESFFEGLPDETLLHVFSQLSLVELYSVIPAVCRRFNALSRDELLWKTVLESRLGIDITPLQLSGVSPDFGPSLKVDDKCKTDPMKNYGRRLYRYIGTHLVSVAFFDSKKNIACSKKCQKIKATLLKADFFLFFCLDNVSYMMYSAWSIFRGEVVWLSIEPETDDDRDVGF